MSFVCMPSTAISVPIIGLAARFPVNRIDSVGRNDEEHAKAMGFTGRQPPFFFLKLTNALIEHLSAGWELSPAT